MSRRQGSATTTGQTINRITQSTLHQSDDQILWFNVTFGPFRTTDDDDRAMVRSTLTMGNGLSTPSALPEARLELTDQGMVSYGLKTAYRDGTTGRHSDILCSTGRPSVSGSGRAVFMAELAALVPRPRTNLTGPPLCHWVQVRFHGVLAPNSRYRE